MRILVAGFGNVLRGDDGFGVEVLRRLSEEELPEGVELLEVGIGGLRLPQELLGGYDRLIVIDAMTENKAPGTLYVRAVDDVAAAQDIDMHIVVPARALMVARALNALPAEVYFVGCEPGEVDDYVMDLTPAVRDAVDSAAAAILDLIARPPAQAIAPVSIERMDELLELLYWMEGEGFAGGSSTLDGMVRFVAQPEDIVRRAMEQLLRRGDVELIDGGEYRLTVIGRREAARRFAEEFAPMLAQGHGECSDPDCDCHSNPEGPAACQGLHNHNHGAHK